MATPTQTSESEISTVPLPPVPLRRGGVRVFRQTYNAATSPIRKVTSAVYRIVSSSDSTSAVSTTSSTPGSLSLSQSTQEGREEMLQQYTITDCCFIYHVFVLSVYCMYSNTGVIWSLFLDCFSSVNLVRILKSPIDFLAYCVPSRL